MTNLLVVCDSEVIEEMARQLLASMEQEPVSYTCSDALDDVYCGSAAMMGPAGAVGEVPLYAAPQLPQPAVLSVPDEIPKLKDGMGFKYVKDGVRYSLNYANGWNQCRAAMLQAEPVSNSDELPLDYLQGHKDGLEWAAQLAEANHPQTGDWLYDDQIDLARAIRKGPDMPTVQGGNSPVIPDDVRRMDWLVSKTVDVREPMVYGSHSLFWSQTITDEEDDYHATKLREQIDAAMAAEQAAAPQQEVK
ncbi:hypothetical protein ACIUQ6_002263 [Escherichia coli]